MKVGLAAVVVAALSLTACGRTGGGGTPEVSPPVGALVLWQGFPAGQHPRPIVWLGNTSPQNGFSTGDAKIAAMCSRFTLGAPLPTNIPGQAVATWTDGTIVTYAGISAAQAFAALARATPGVNASDCTKATPLVITAARFGLFGFDTDRGKAQMSAWLFTANGALGEFAFPALVPTAFWSGGMSTRSDGVATVTADGRSLTFTFYGAPDNSGPCGASYKGVVAESSAAVAVAVQMIPNSPPDAPIACTAIAQERSVTVSLASPLGGRVVADATGAAVSVCLVGSARGC